MYNNYMPKFSLWFTAFLQTPPTAWLAVFLLIVFFSLVSFR